MGGDNQRINAFGRAGRAVYATETGGRPVSHDGGYVPNQPSCRLR